MSETQVRYFHPVVGQDGKYLSTANIIWAERDRGSAYYRVSKYAMKGGTFPANHPVGGTRHATDGSQMGSGEKIEAFRARGYWASCFPEGDGITLKWWDDKPDTNKTAEQVMRDIQECFGWEVVNGRSPIKRIRAKGQESQAMTEQSTKCAKCGAPDGECYHTLATLPPTTYSKAYEAEAREAFTESGEWDWSSFYAGWKARDEITVAAAIKGLESNE